MDNMKKKIKEALMRDQKEFIFEGVDYYQEKTLDEFFSENDREDYIWDETLEESLTTVEDEEITGDRAREFKVGDIIMTNRFKSHGSYVENSPHRILIITSRKGRGDEITYSGFLFSSKVHNSNKNGKYPHNIYIKNYSSVLYKGARSDKEAFIRVNDLVSFTNKDLSTTGSWKGRASYEFLEFIQQCVNNYRTGKDNSNMYWEKN